MFLFFSVLSKLCKTGRIKIGKIGIPRSGCAARRGSTQTAVRGCGLWFMVIMVMVMVMVGPGARGVCE
ncbi:hypothetical protein P167DRAFT_250887 [Morchella conica CCBAS932]|uniref:Uncharacterized protein n=1 Tax=Morchella conica CCBAS932 TaxID=1392247 RepID=A0A3N4KMP4_9PEZI|nr:hypothetical protein P167DRAFT_250887 [Morchella conica CCBAS932]